MDAKLSDICISTSAAPTYLPAHQFRTQDKDGKVKEFNLIDGAIAANNPTLIATSEVTKQIYAENKDFFPIKPCDYGRFLVISIGTGTAKLEQKFNAKTAAKWGILGWLTKGGSNPIIDVFTQGGDDMVDYYNSVAFQALRSEDNYLRIQDDRLSGRDSSVDIATKENMAKLVEIGEKLLKKPVSRINLKKGIFEPQETGGTNEEILKRFAAKLSEEKKLRDSNCRHANNTT